VHQHRQRADADVLQPARLHHGNGWPTFIYCTVPALYRVAHKKRPQFSALEKTHVVSLGRIALAVG